MDLAALNTPTSIVVRSGLLLLVASPVAAREYALPLVREWPGATNHVSLRGTIAVATMDTGLGVVDVSDPAKPQLLARLPRVGLRGNAYAPPYAYAIAGSEFLSVDLRSPSAPAWLASFAAADEDIPYSALSVHNGCAYIGSGSESGGLTILDLSDPVHPQLMSWLDIGAATDIATSGTLCATVAGTTCTFIDVSDPRAPLVLSTATLRPPSPPPGTTLDEAAVRIALHGSTAYCLTSGSVYSPPPFRHLSRLQAVDLSHLVTPVVRDPILLAGGEPVCSAFEIHADTLYAGTGTHLDAFDVATSSTPILRDTIEFPAAPFDMAFDGDQAAIAMGDLGIDDFTNPLSPTPVGVLAALSDVTLVRTGEGVACVRQSTWDNTSVVRFVDINDSIAGAIPATYGDAHNISDMLVRDHTLLVADLVSGFGRIHTLDITNPWQPQLVSLYGTFGTARQIALASGTLVVADGWAGLHLADFTDPAHPVLASYATVTSGTLDRMVVSGSDVLAPGFGAWNITDPAHPLSLQLGSPPGVVSAMAPADSGLMALGRVTGTAPSARMSVQFADYSDVGNPVLVGNPIDLGPLLDVGRGVTSLDFHQGYLYATVLDLGLTTDTTRVQVLDPFDPDNIRLVATPLITSGLLSLDFSSDLMIVANEGTLQSYRIQRESAPALAPLLGASASTVAADHNADAVLDVADLVVTGRD